MFFYLIVFVLSLILTLLFFLYGSHLYYLLFAAKKYLAPPLKDQQDCRPPVCIHLPIYNEKNVIIKVASACAAMAESYGKDKVRIMILDDSDDDTIQVVDRIVKEYQQQKIKIDVVRRRNRDEYKAGALQAALEKTSEEYIAIFDADFIPPVDFLERTVPYLAVNDHLGIIQSRWSFTNKDFNAITRAVSHIIDVHFLIEQPGRYAKGCFQNFNGSGGLLRKKAILEAGGWQGDTLAEDLDLSYRIQLCGYHVLYLQEVLCPGEIPANVPSYKLQQSRWANGSLKVALKILPGLLRDRRFSWRKRLLAFLHLTGYMIQPLMVFSFVLAVLAAFGGFNSYQFSSLMSISADVGGMGASLARTIISLQYAVWAILTPFIVLCALAPWVAIITTLNTQKLSILRNLGDLLVLLLISLGISLSILNGAFRALFTRRRLDWTRTPKLADLQENPYSRRGRYFLPLDPIWIGEFLFAVVGLVACWAALVKGNISGLLILLPFTISYIFVLSASILQRRNERGRDACPRDSRPVQAEDQDLRGIQIKTSPRDNR